MKYIIQYSSFLSFWLNNLAIVMQHGCNWILEEGWKCHLCSKSWCTICWSAFCCLFWIHEIWVERFTEISISQQSGPRAFGETLHGRFAADDTAENHLFVSHLMLLYFSAFGWWMGFPRGPGPGQEHCQYDSRGFAFWNFFLPVGLCKRSMESGNTFHPAVEIRPSFGESHYFSIYFQKVWFISGFCMASFSPSQVLKL